LDALELEEEVEGPSYLTDINKVPDYLDEAPMEEKEVSFVAYLSFFQALTIN
jgi:charged multivesicular body protein 5